MSQLRVGSIATISGTSVLSLNNGILTDPNKPLFYAYNNTGTLPGGQTAQFNATFINIGGHYSTSLYRFTAPIAGTYWFSCTGLPNTTTGSFFQFMKNGVGLQYPRAHAMNHDETVTISMPIQLLAGDYVAVYINSDGMEQTWSGWSGFLIG